MPAFIHFRELWRRLGIPTSDRDMPYMATGPVIPVDIVARSENLVSWPRPVAFIFAGRTLGAAAARPAVRLVSGKNGIIVRRAKAIIESAQGVGISTYRRPQTNNMTVTGTVNAMGLQPIDGQLGQGTNALGGPLTGLTIQCEVGTCVNNVFTTSFGSVPQFTEALTLDDFYLGSNVCLQFQGAVNGAAEALSFYFHIEAPIGSNAPEFSVPADL